MIKLPSRLSALALLSLTPWLFGFSLTDGAEEKAEFIDGLKRDIIKVEHSIEVTKDLIKKSKGAKFLPDIKFRLAELHVEKSRLVYYLEVEERGAEAANSPEAKLLKNEAITIYRDVMREFPEYRYNDKILFFMGHEYHELGMHEDMLESYKKLVDEYPKSTLLLESLYIIGNYYFDHDQLDDAEKTYNKILEYRESHIHDMARYRLAWVAINKARLDKKWWKKAIQLFETVVLSTATTDEDISVDTHKPINIKLEALNGIVFCYTEVYKPKIALEYFRKLASSKTVYVHALEKLANRYFIKEQFDNAALLYRRIIELSDDVDKNLDYAQRIYDASSYSKKKDKVDEDVRAIVKAASKYAFSWRIADNEKKQLAKGFEVYSRDIVTKLHLLAQQRKEKRAFRIAARAYQNYLSFFEEYSEKILDVKYNYAEALFNSDQYLPAGRAYEDIARVMDESKDRKDALYSCIQAYQYALGGAKYLSRFELVESRQALKQLGAYFVKKYPNDEKTPTIKFNVARMFYDQGEYEQAIESFNEYINQYPAHSEVAVAGHLVLDCYKQMEDYEGLARQGREYAGNASIKDEKFKKEVGEIVAAAEHRELDKKTLEVTKEGGDAIEELLKYAGEMEVGGKAEKALYRSFVMAKEKRNIEMAFKAGAQLAAQYKKSQYLEDVYGTLGNFSAQMADFERAAALYEDYYNRFPEKPEAREAMFAAARFHSYLGNQREAIKDYKVLLEKASGDERGRILVEIADAYAMMDDWRMVLSSAQKAVSEVPSSVKGQLLYAKALKKRNKIEEAKQSFMAAASLGTGPADMELAAEAQFRLAEMLMGDYRKVRFGAGQEDAVVVQTKMQLIGMMEQFYAGVVEMKEPQWAIAALFRLSELYADFGDFLDKAPVPADLTPDQQKQYRQMLAEQVKAQKAAADTYLNTCRKTVREKKVFGDFAMACITGVPPAASERIARRRGGKLSGPQADGVKDKLLKNPSDLDSLDELAGLAIAAGDTHLARLVLSKALEVNENHAPSLDLMGVVSLYVGDEQDAYDYFKRSMDSDSRYVPARLNVAGLFIKYKDEARAKAVIKTVASNARTIDLSTPDIHPLAKDALRVLKIR
ncbi:MAG: tetratricopeptide repeat protein [Deltaproteobacteria bacterium]|nr:tetratricopeptide repeat protein [Deltaproteobacteria bacterium]